MERKIMEEFLSESAVMGKDGKGRQSEGGGKGQRKDGKGK